VTTTVARKPHPAKPLAVAVSRFVKSALQSRSLLSAGECEVW
jgi:hypothetical protein